MDESARELMKLAETTSKKSNCARRSVGAVLERDGEILSVGWNGVDPRFASCVDAGCPRCIEGGDVGSGYDQCICIHAEQKAVATAAARGIPLDGASAYLTLRPCFGCLVMMRWSGIRRVFFTQDWVYAAEAERIYERLTSEFDAFECLQGVASQQ